MGRKGIVIETGKANPSVEPIEESIKRLLTRGFFQTRDRECSQDFRSAIAAAKAERNNSNATTYGTFTMQKDNSCVEDQSMQ